METWITVWTFSSANELAVIRARLESEGIECFVKDEFTTLVQPLYSNAIGGVKLQVKTSDVQAAVEVLKDAGYQQEEEKSSVVADHIYNFFSRIKIEKELSYYL